MKIAILGGAGAFGSWYAKLFSSRGHNVIITRKKGPEGIPFVTDNREAVKDADIVIISTPIEVVGEVVQEVIHEMKENSLLVDFASVKINVCEELKKYIDEPIEIGSVHPMHGPRVKSLEMKKVIFIPIKPGEKYNWLKKFFENEKAIVIETTPEEHDSALAVVQCLTHFSAITAAATIVDGGYSIEKLRKFSSPNYELFSSLISRIVLQDPNLYARIQVENEESKKIREIFIRNAIQLNDLANKKEVDEIAKIIVKGAKGFDKEETFLYESDKLVEAINSELSYLSSSIGKKILVKNITTGNYHYGKLEEVTGNEITILEGKRKVKLLTTNIHLLRDNEVLEWKKKNLRLLSRDYSFLVGKDVDEKEVVSIFSLIPGIFEASLLDVYRSENFKDKKSITIRVKFFEDEDRNSINEEILKKIKGLNYELR